MGEHWEKVIREKENFEYRSNKKTMGEHWEKVIREADRKGFVEKEKIPETVPHNYSEVFDSKRLSQTYLFNTEFGFGNVLEQRSSLRNFRPASCLNQKRRK